MIPGIAQEKNMANLPSAQEVAQNWVSGASAKQKRYQDGVNRVTDNPMAKAASPDAQARYQQNTAAAVSSGRMASALNSVSLDEWKRLTSGKASNWSSGISLAREKFIRKMSALLSFQSSVLDRVRAMPKGTFEERQARQQEYARLMHEYKTGNRG